MDWVRERTEIKILRELGEGVMDKMRWREREREREREKKKKRGENKIVKGKFFP